MNAPPTRTVIVTPAPRRSKRQQDALGTRKSARAMKRGRHGSNGNDERIYGEDYGILPSD